MRFSIMLCSLVMVASTGCYYRSDFDGLSVSALELEADADGKLWCRDRSCGPIDNPQKCDRARVDFDGDGEPETCFVCYGERGEIISRVCGDDSPLHCIKLRGREGGECVQCYDDQRNLLRDTCDGLIPSSCNTVTDADGVSCETCTYAGDTTTRCHAPRCFDPADPRVTYVARTPDCLLLDFACSPPEVRFDDDCGCGCLSEDPARTDADVASTDSDADAAGTSDANAADVSDANGDGASDANNDGATP